MEICTFRYTRKKFVRKSFCLDSNAKLALFRAFILSHFQYCAAVWSHCSAPNALYMLYGNAIWKRFRSGLYSVFIPTILPPFAFWLLKSGTLARGIENNQTPQHFQRWPASLFFHLIKSIVRCRSLENVIKLFN